MLQLETLESKLDEQTKNSLFLKFYSQKQLKNRLFSFFVGLSISHYFSHLPLDRLVSAMNGKQSSNTLDLTKTAELSTDTERKYLIFSVIISQP